VTSGRRVSCMAKVQNLVLFFMQNRLHAAMISTLVINSAISFVTIYLVGNGALKVPYAIFLGIATCIAAVIFIIDRKPCSAGINEEMENQEYQDKPISFSPADNVFEKVAEDINLMAVSSR
jgi:hypothetical protein